MIIRWLLQQVHPTVTWRHELVARLLLVVFASCGMGLATGMMRDGHLYIEAGVMGVYVDGFGFEVIEDEHKVQVWRCSDEGWSWHCPADSVPVIWARTEES